MIDALIRWLVKALLWLRYRMRVDGLDAVAARGTRGILFLPNHPALIDPIIVFATLHRRFRPRGLADADQIDRPLVRTLARRVGIIPLPDIRKEGPAARDRVEGMIRLVADGLRSGQNFVLYPSGHIYRTRLEDLRGNSAVEDILRLAPDVRIVLIRTRGLWGSGFSLAGGGGVLPDVAAVLRRGVLGLLASFVVFAPRRRVRLDAFEPDDLPRGADRHGINGYIERWFNTDPPPNTYVPYSIWEIGGVRPLLDPPAAAGGASAADVPASTRTLVAGYLAKLVGRDSVKDDERLAEDLGLDSLMKAEVVLWLGAEFGATDVDVDALRTVGDVMLAARGQAVAAKVVDLVSPPRVWFRRRAAVAAKLPDVATVNAAFLAQAARRPDAVVVADTFRGALTYRQVITAVLALRPHVAALPGERVGILLPASVGAAIAYLTVLFTGRTPVMVNWTTGARNVRHALELTAVQRVLTSQALLKRLAGQGHDLQPLEPYMAPLEQIGAAISRWDKLAAFLRSYVDWSPLRSAAAPEAAVVLLTSGSESLPKAAPLTHTNLLANIGDVLDAFCVREDDAMMGFLPPFHSFGLTITTLLPLLVGCRVVYHPNPTDAAMIGKLIEAYRATIVCGTPTFLSGIARATQGDQLSSLRLAVTGAEKCSEQVYALLGQRCPHAMILEGYGITECSPVVAANREGRIRHGTIGNVMRSIEYVIVDTERGEPVRDGEVGMLLVRGPSVFNGYLGDAPDPFVEYAGRRWYRTGDLVTRDADGVLTFRGRLKRFVKLGGEMVSLPAIEEVLLRAFGHDGDDGPAVAVEAAGADEHPEVVLFTTRREVDRAAANAAIRAAGLSALHNVSRVETVDAIPVLGTGKTDYRALRARLN